jgi:hypothetical protein
MKSDFGKLEAIFQNMADDGFDTTKPLKWGFYFFDQHKSKLVQIYNELRDNNYVQEGIEQMDDKSWRLFVTKIEVLNAEMLHKRNNAFNDLVSHFDADLYDGWEVEKI